MADVNVVAVSGRVTANPVLRFTQSGRAVLSFSVATNDRVKVGDRWEDRPNYVECSVFGAGAESLSRIMAKGRQVFVCGRLHWRSWEKDGERRSQLSVVVDRLSLGAVPAGQAQADQAPAQQPCQAPAAPVAYQAAAHDLATPEGIAQAFYDARQYGEEIPL